MTDMTRAMAQFVKWALSEGPWNGGDLEGYEIQTKAAELGLLVRTAYDPEVHGEDDCAEPGEDWFVMAPELLELLKE